ncbi:dicarboxylate--CoA ligase PimA [Devosia pacifica]|uniref:Dicarboxylate--CoA ligase PimA n=1 Tax=Devosia pacifica TaxID=1335967 RepID=A0A918SEK0_9HYPH|nr:long-chain fatty acid--CoA ligase [Devosia pacifica]GHA37638.1 dicarboxylate--CoA ligase PimA [Devosia pacifica]
MAQTSPGDRRQWESSYPDGIEWSTPLDTRPVHVRLIESCARTPSATALDFLGYKMSYRSLGRQVENLAASLQQQFGVKKGTRVALLLPNTPFYPVAYFAVLMAGGTVVNCNPLYTVPELEHIVGDAGAELLITIDLKQVFPKAEALLEHGTVKSAIVCEFATALPLVKRLMFSAFRRDDLADVDAATTADKLTKLSTLMGQNNKPAPVEIDPLEDIAVQQYTGGTTGTPKGAMLSHANISANMSQLELWGDGLFAPSAKVVAVLPFFHIFAMTVCMNLPLITGCQVIMLPRFELAPFAKLLRRTRPNILPAVPTLIAAIARAKGIGADELQSIEVAISGGAPLSHEVRDEYAKKSSTLLAEGYGLTEASPVVCCAALRNPSKPMSIGLPIPGTDVRFADIDSGEIVEPGADGELQVRGPQVMSGYFGDEEATGETLKDGWLRTGDVGHMDEDGYVFLVDRIKDLIICSGFNVYPRTIEEALAEHEAVEEVTVIGVPDSYRGEAPVAYVKVREGHSPKESELKSYLSDKLNKVEMPREIIFKEELPKTLIGKLSKKELRAEHAEMRDRTREQA